MPQYIWIALILDALGREAGLITLGQIMQDLNKQGICIAELSKILSLEDKKQHAWYSIINSYIPKSILGPLSVVFSFREYPCFFDCYCSPEIDVDEKISTLMRVIDKNLSFHSNDSTDICFIINWFYATSNTLSIAPGCSMIADALCQYYKHSHDDDIMRSFRPSIRAMAQGLGFDLDVSFSHKFWNELAQITSCEPIVLQLSQKEKHMNKAYVDTIKRFSDVRIINVFNDTLPYRIDALKADHLDCDVQNHITYVQTLNQTDNVELLCFYVLKYSYFIRNKYFHAEKAYPFFILKETAEIKEMRKLSEIFEYFLADLIRCNALYLKEEK